MPNILDVFAEFAGRRKAPEFDTKAALDALDKRDAETARQLRDTPKLTPEQMAPVAQKEATAVAVSLAKCAGSEGRMLHQSTDSLQSINTVASRAANNQCNAR